MKNLFDLTGKVALVTGASSGMGKAIAEAMGAQGAKVVVSSHDTEGGYATIKEFENKNIEAVFIACDVSKKAEIKQLYDKSITIFGKIDILASCVGVAMPKSFLDINEVDFEKTMALNLQSAIYLTKLVVPQMQQRKNGVLIYLASIAGVRGNKNAWVLADNMLFPPHHKHEAEAYRKRVRETNAFDSVLLPIGSGIEMSFFR